MLQSRPYHPKLSATRVWFQSILAWRLGLNGNTPAKHGIQENIPMQHAFLVMEAQPQQLPAHVVATSAFVHARETDGSEQFNDFAAETTGCAHAREQGRAPHPRKHSKNQSCVSQ